MPSLKDLLPATRGPVTIDLGRRCGHAEARVAYIPANVSLANDVPDEDDDDLERDWDEPSIVATNLCELVTEWDVTGPLVNKRTKEPIVADGAPVPLDPMVVQHVPWAILAGVMSGVTAAENPNPSRRRRKR